jgi:hypothetical protein
MTQAQRIVDKFGGARQLAAAIGYSKHAVHRWLRAKEKGGSGGFIPSAALPKIKEAASLLGITIKPEDWEA